MKKNLSIVCLLILNSLSFGHVNAQEIDKASLKMEKKVLRRSQFIPGLFDPWKHTGEVRIDSFRVKQSDKLLNFYLSPTVTHIPVRTQWVESLKSDIISGLGRPFDEYRVQLWSRGHLLEDYVPNLYRDSRTSYDVNRLADTITGIQLVSDLNRPVFKSGLTGRHIALWPSHGFFYDQLLDRWQWQRARLYETVEDIYPWSFTSAYLVPMLENAGATVLLPRERDTQAYEVIIDNDASTAQSELIVINGKSKWEMAKPGFALADTLFTGQNPFTGGGYLNISTSSEDTARLIYVPDIPEAGEYAVYVSWAKPDTCTGNVHYEVNYTGGLARFSVNQCMGAGTWIYLGKFHFQEGKHKSSGSVIVYGEGVGGTVTSDAVRFGGGMGNVVRKPGKVAEPRQKSSSDGMFADEIRLSQNNTDFTYKLSGKPRWMEGARYYLQYSGMPDSVVYNLNAGKNDYNDDYMSRGEWINYLIGQSKTQYNDKYNKGLNIPVDLALAFHTDAGVTPDDSVIGTLGIYSAVRNNGLFPDGRSKLASRDLSDLIQTQIVEDIRQLINPQWTRRGLWDREYSEAWRPIVPVMLLELLSHQNLADMKFGLDPRFKFTVSRAIYKGMLRYLAAESENPAIIQPLPPDHMAIEVFGIGKIKISWKAVADPLEKTALPDGFKVYMKTEDNGFDTGVFTRDTFMIISLPELKKIYSFRVTALNDGGESLPGETLSASLFPGNMKPVLIVNAFDRICGPAVFDKGDMAGIASWEDEGVAHDYDFSHSGQQYDFNRNSDWLHDDSQGWGASSAEMETIKVQGNTFSFPLVHGKAIRDAGHPFVSVSDEVFESTGYDTGKYQVVDIIFGEERGTDSYKGSTGKDFRLLTPAMRESITEFTQKGGNLFISGAYVGTDMIENKDSSAISFASDVLHYTWRTNHATRVGSVYTTDQATGLFPGKIQFNTTMHPELYKVESPDAIEPSGSGAMRIYRYESGDCSAGVAYKGSYRTVVLGFPFESVMTDSQRVELISQILKFFNE